MPIPDFDYNGVLPPHLGQPTEISQLSPYPASSVEICERFGTSNERKAILTGWLELRAALRGLGYRTGFQWLDGSFVEDAEQYRGRAPADIDVVSFLHPSSLTISQMDSSVVAIIRNHDATKRQFKVDHFPLMLNWPGAAIVEQTRYWCGLFSHRRVDDVWKGMLRVELDSVLDDETAKRLLEPTATT